MSENREKGGIRGYLSQVLKALHEGLKPAEIERRGKKGEGIPRSTLDEILSLLEKEKVVYKDADGKWYYRWKKEKEELMSEYQKFTNEEEYKQKLRHSESLVRAIKKDIGRGALLYRESFRYFIEHLKTGYPDTHELYGEWETLYHEMKAVEKNFNEEIKEIIREEGFEIVEYHNLKEDRNQLSPEIFNIVEENLHLDRQGLHKPIKLEVKDKGIWAEGKNISKNKDVLEELKKLIETCIQSESAKNLYEQVAVIKEKERKMYAKLRGEISYICMNVIEDAVPLRGSCKRCKIITGRSP